MGIVLSVCLGSFWERRAVSLSPAAEPTETSTPSCQSSGVAAVHDFTWGHVIPRPSTPTSWDWVVTWLFGFNREMLVPSYLRALSGHGTGHQGSTVTVALPLSLLNTKLLTSTVKIQCQFLSEPDCLPGTGHQRGFRQRYPPMPYWLRRQDEGWWDSVKRKLY